MQANEFHDETIRPDQHYTATRSSMPGDAERRLMIAILEDAVQCFKNGLKNRSEQAQINFADAKAWFFEDEPGDEDYIFSCRSICEVLELSLPALREQLLHLESEAHQGPAIEAA